MKSMNDVVIGRYVLYLSTTGYFVWVVDEEQLGPIHGPVAYDDAVCFAKTQDAADQQT